MLPNAIDLDVGHLPEEGRVDDDQSMASSFSVTPCARLKSTQQRPSDPGALLLCTKSSKMTKSPNGTNYA
jgi:hypothetical protein